MAEHPNIMPLVAQKPSRTGRNFLVVCGLLTCTPLVACLACVVFSIVAVELGLVPDTVATAKANTATYEVANLMTATVQTWTPVPTKTPRPPTSTPAPLGESEVLGLIAAAMKVIDLPINAIEMQGSDLAISTDQMRGGYDNELDYRSTFIGALVGSVVETYESENISTRPPRRIQIYFTEGSLIAVKVTLNYADAKNFLDGNMTFNQFLDRWIVE